MAATNGEKSLELSVRNFGPIAEADIELRPLSVFVGPSNTGKSYLATLIYALHQFFGGYAAQHFRRASMVTDNARTPQLPPKEVFQSKSEVIDFLRWVTSLPAHDSGSFGGLDRPGYVVTETIQSLIRSVINDPIYHGEKLDSEVARTSGVNAVDRLVHYASGAYRELSVCLGKADPSKHASSFRYDVEALAGGGRIASVVQGVLPTEIRADLGEWGALVPISVGETDDSQEIAARVMLARITSWVVADMVGPLGHQAHYLPADRAGAVRSHSALTGSLVERASRPSVANQPATFPGVYGDYLERLVGLGGLPTNTASHFDELADDVERNILEGDIWIESNLAGYPSFSYRPDGWEWNLPLMNASSMVSELAPVVLYLRHVVQPGETLIIEEPESALHPEMQVEFTRLLAAAVKAGIRIIITTHSEWVLEELANLVLMSELPVEQRQGFEGADLALSPDEVGAWLFEPDAEIGGTVIKEMPLDKEMGNFPSGFGLVTTDLYNRYTRIANRIEMLTEE